MQQHRPSSPPHQHQSSAASAAAEAAERRLREAEERLKEAIEELQRRQRGSPGGDLCPPCDHSDDSCVANAVGNLCQSFLLSYGIRAGIGILLRAFKLVRLKSYSSLLDLKQLVSEKDLIVREEACRIGLLFGGFTGSYHALRCLLRKLRKKEMPINVYLQFKEAPARTCWHAVTRAVRSTTFLSAFVGIFQGVICLHRKVSMKDHKLVYWLAGVISALSVLLEKKARRKELALYVFPQAGNSLWCILVNRHFVPNIKNAEVALFCACMGGIMYYLEHEPDTMAPFLRGLIKRFLASRISNPGPSPTQTASYAHLHTLDAMKKPDTGKQREQAEFIV